MWSETVDAASLDGKIWPRTAAVAERLWSSKENTVLSIETYLRLEAQRCRMVSLSISHIEFQIEKENVDILTYIHSFVDIFQLRAGVRANPIRASYCDTGPLVKIE